MSNELYITNKRVSGENGNMNNQMKQGDNKSYKMAGKDFTVESKVFHSQRKPCLPVGLALPLGHYDP